jgi:hypothetical protein
MKVVILNSDEAALVDDSGFQMERGEKKDFDLAYRQALARRTLRGAKRPLATKSLSYYFYYLDRRDGMSRAAALAKHIAAAE